MSRNTTRNEQVCPTNGGRKNAIKRVFDSYWFWVSGPRVGVGLAGVFLLIAPIIALGFVLTSMQILEVPEPVIQACFGVMALIAFFGAGVFFLIVVPHHLSLQRKKKEAVRRAREERANERNRLLAEQMQERELASQDPDFYDRKMQRLLERMGSNEELDPPEVEYWEAPNLELEKTRPRPLQLIQFLIARICKSMYGSGATQ